MNDDEYPAAMELLRDPEEAARRMEWKCSRCGETVPGHFDDCWNCSKSE